MSRAFRTFGEMSSACDDAWRLLNTGEADAAGAAFLDFWARDDIGVKALRGLAQHATAQGESARAETLWRTLDALAPGDRHTRHGLGVALMQMRKFEEAAQVFSALAEAFPDFVAALRGLGQIGAMTGEASASLDHFEKAARCDPANIVNTRDCVKAAVKAGFWARAEFHLDELRRRGDDGGVVATLARALDQGRAGEGRAREANAAPADALWTRWREAERARSAGEIDAAREGLQDILGAAPDFVPAVRSLASLQREQGDAAAAGRILATGLTHRPGDPWLLLDQAQQCVRDGRFDDADLLSRTLAEGGGASAAAAALELFYCLRMRGRDGDAAEFLAAALPKAPQDLGLRLAQAGLLLADHDLDGAERIYRELATGPADGAWPLIGLGNVAKMRGDDNTAAQNYLAAIESTPERPHAYAELSGLVGAREARAKAREFLRAWASRRPDDPEPLRLLARHAAADRDFAGATKIYAELCARWPNDVPAMLDMANLALRRGDASQAVEWFDRAAVAAPQHVAVLEARARRAEMSDDPELALMLYNEVLRRDPARCWIALEKIKLRQALGPFEAAVTELEAFRAERGETADYFVARIELFRNAGDFAAAAAAADAGRKTFPHHGRLRVKAALLDAELGRFEFDRGRWAGAARDELRQGDGRSGAMAARRGPRPHRRRAPRKTG